MQSLFDRIPYLCLYVSDYEASVRFYRDILAMTPVYPEHDIKTTNFYPFKTGTTYIAIEPGGTRKTSQKTKAENPMLIQFRADSLEELEIMNQQLESKGVTLIARSLQESYAVLTKFLDPDGNLLEIIYQTEDQNDHQKKL